MISIRSFILAVIVLWMSPLMAQNAESSAVRFKEKKATLNFEDELVQGATQKPELFYLFQKKNFNYKRLIKLRENFLPEMRRTTEDMQRVRGGH
ncbi:MAG: hypothetical protein ACOYOK_00500 [Pseudobdellovibrionaceae bacterium]